MAVDDPKVVDIAGIDLATGRVMLTIADHLDWEDLEDHLLILQDKINAYLAFMEGEQIDEFPDLRGKPIQIEVIFREEPPERALPFLKEAQSIIEGAGFFFSWQYSGTIRRSFGL